jgi:hypothetical protein
VPRGCAENSVIHDVILGDRSRHGSRNKRKRKRKRKRRIYTGLGHRESLNFKCGFFPHLKKKLQMWNPKRVQNIDFLLKFLQMWKKPHLKSMFFV